MGKFINSVQRPIVKGKMTWQNFNAEGYFQNATLGWDKDLELL